MDLAEEVRISLLGLIRLILNKNDVEVIPFVPDLCATLAKLLLDPNPAMKEVSRLSR